MKRLKELLPGAKKGLVGIEAMDGAGSGVVVSSDGLILTAAHVIGKTGKKMKVRFPDGKTASAISLGGSEISDAGMLQILDKGPWPFVEIAKNKNSKIGDWCFGIGHPAIKADTNAWVIKKPNPEEKKLIADSFDKAIFALDDILHLEWLLAMNKLHSK